MPRLLAPLLALSAVAVGAVLPVSAQAAEGQVQPTVNEIGRDRAARLSFSVPGQFTLQRSSATGLPLLGSYAFSQPIDNAYACSVSLGVDTLGQAVFRERYVQATGRTLRVVTPFGVRFRLTGVERHGRVRGADARWYQSATTVNQLPAFASDPLASTSGAAVLPGALVKKGSYGVLVDVIVVTSARPTTSPASPLTSEQAKACTELGQRLGPPTVRRVLRNVRLERGSAGPLT